MRVIIGVCNRRCDEMRGGAIEDCKFVPYVSLGEEDVNQ